LTKLNKNKMLKKLNTQNCIITRQNNGLVYSSPAHFTLIELCNIFGSSKIGIRQMPTSFTFNKTTMSNRISIMTDTTTLRGVSGIDINNSYSFLKSFIFNKTLELVKSPLVNPLIVFSSFSDSFQIFHNDYIAIKTSNNRLANVVILKSHKPSPTSREFFQLSLRSPRAFRLKNRNKSVVFNSQLFNILSKEFTFGSDSNFIDAEVNAQNFTMLVRSLDIFPSEYKSKVIFILRFSQETFSNLPFKIFQSIIRNLNRNLNSALNGGNAQNIIFKGETSWFIVFNRNFFNEGFCLCLFDHPTRLFNAGNSKLGGESHISQIPVNKRVEFNIISDFHTPSNINTMLKPFFIQFNSFQNRFSNFQFYWNTSNQHCKKTTNSNYLNISEDGQFIPALKDRVSLPKTR